MKKQRYLPLLWIIALLALWEAAAHFSGVSPLLLPPVEDVARALWRELFAGTLGLQLLLSLGLILLALSVSFGLALLLVLLGRRSRLLKSLLDTLSALLHPLPGVALLPLVVLWLGTGGVSVFAIMVHACLWSLIISLKEGFASVPEVYLRAGQNLSLSPLRLELEILLPGSAAALLSGLRVGWARAWRAFISAEMVFGAVSSLGGVGWYLFRQRAFMNTPALFAGLMCVMAVGYGMETLAFGALEKATVRRWGVSSDAA